MSLNKYLIRPSNGVMYPACNAEVWKEKAITMTVFHRFLSAQIFGIVLMSSSSLALVDEQNYLTVRMARTIGPMPAQGLGCL